jgi:putative FmdB family regulatory protein
MPTYGYKCQKCAHEFEVRQSIADAPLSVCPKENCGQKKWGRGKVTRGVGGGAGLLFKGSGFYITDYRSDKYKQAAKSDSAPAKDSTPAKTPAAEPKPAAKPAAKPDKK